MLDTKNCWLKNFASKKIQIKKVLRLKNTLRVDLVDIAASSPMRVLLGYCKLGLSYSLTEINPVASKLLNLQPKQTQNFDLEFDRSQDFAIGHF